MLENLQNKKIAMVGMGVNNQKLAQYLKQHGIDFDVFENWKSPDELVGRLDSYNLIFRTPGLPFLSQAIQQAKSAGAEISSQTKLFFELCPAPIIGVTGTKGKGTTASLIAKILTATGKTNWLGGNIGRDPFEFLDEIKNDDIVILELSSFQLQDLGCSPHISVVLNITSDHLNHHESVEEYVKAKTAVLEHQTEKDFAVLDPRLPDWFKNLGTAKKIFFNPQEVSGFETKLLGKHNLENIAAAAATAKLLGIEEQFVRQAVSGFKALPHHLEIIRTVNNITYVDDAVSTNIEPTMAAIDALPGPVILIVGGHDKGVDFTELGHKIAESKNIKALVVIGEVTDKILRSIEGYQGKVFTGAKSMREILTQAQSVAVAGDNILISPATDSFDLFKNMYDRAEQFARAVNSLS